jgi:hypothetical protein
MEPFATVLSTEHVVSQIDTNVYARKVRHIEEKEKGESSGWRGGE